MSNNIKIRETIVDDLDAMETLWKDFMDFHQARDPLFTRSTDGHKKFAEFIRRHMSSEESCVLVAESSGKVVAYALGAIASYPPVFVDKQYGEVIDLAVSEAFRRQGVGEQLFRQLQDWFTQKGIHRLEARVALTNETSTAFWRKMGFTPYLETVAKQI